MNEGSGFDFLIVGAGLYGASVARLLTDGGYSVLVVEKRDHIAGNAYTEIVNGICVHRYGPHVFHTDNEKVWSFVNRFTGFNDFINRPAAYYHGELYSLPFNMSTFKEMWGVSEPEEAGAIIHEQIMAAGLENIKDEDDKMARQPANLEEQAISLVGTDIYEKLIKGYTEKQWGRQCSELPAYIIRRIPVRYEYNDNYFDDKYQGIPESGYTEMVSHMLDGIKVMTGIDYLDPENREWLDPIADHIVFSGQIDEYFGYCYGPLGYRGLRFETEYLASERFFQDRAVINYTDRDIPWIRITEHKHFAAARPADSVAEGTVITKEYPEEWKPGEIAFYPINDDVSRERYFKYRELAEAESKVSFGGRLGCYRYYDMDDVIAEAIDDAEKLIADRCQN